MKNKLLAITVLISGFSYGQARVVFTSNAYVVIDNSAKFVIDNPATNAVVPAANAGFKTESEFDQVKWNIGATAGTFQMPFVAVDNTAIPFTVNVGTAGTVSAAPGHILFSTYPGATWDNNVYKPTDVTHMFDYNTNSVNNSDNVIDRFWIIDAQNYSTKPSSTFSFTYRDVEHTQVGNNIVEADLGAQRFHPGPNVWGDYLPQGTTNAATNTTSGVPVVPADFWRSWTLSEVTSPLSVGLTHFSAVCNDGSIGFGWQTAYENETDHFEIERMNASNDFQVVGFVAAQGGTTLTNYNFDLNAYREGVFRLVEVTTNGSRNIVAENYVNCGEFDEPVVSYDAVNNTIHIIMNSNSETQETFGLYDSAGKLIHEQEFTLYNGTNTVSIPVYDLSVGVYPVRITSNNKVFTSKILESLK